MQRSVRSLLIYILCALLYISCIRFAYSSAQSLYGSGRVLTDAPHAWLREALPWTVACLAALYLSNVQFTKRPLLRILAPGLLSLVTTCWLVKGPFPYSLDILRYLWDGRLWIHGISPYRYVPANPHLSAFQHWRYWGLLGWKQWPEAYPPLAQIYFWFIARFSNGSIQGYKIWMLLNDVVSVVLFYRVLVVRATSSGKADARNSLSALSSRDYRQLALFMLFPPLLIESMGTAHVDAFAIPWLLWAWTSGLKNQPVRMGIAIGMATAIKLYPVVLFAALWNRRDKSQVFKSLLAFTITIAVVCYPFVRGGGMLSFFSHISSMAYNGSLEHVLFKLFGPVIDRHSTLIVLGFELLVWYMLLFTRLSDESLEKKASLAGLAFVLASPLVHPWYLVSILPFAIAADDVATLWMAFASHLTYDEVPLDLYVEYVPTYVAYIWNFVRPFLAP